MIIHIRGKVFIDTNDSFLDSLLLYSAILWFIAGVVRYINKLIPW